MDQQEQDKFIKLVIVGSQRTGKTCIIKKYCYDKFDDQYAATIGCDFSMKVTSYKDETVKLQLWDISGQEQQITMSKLYLRGALGCIVVADIQEKESLDECIKWQQIINQHSEPVNGKKIPIFLAQNKFDETQQKENLEEYQTLQFLEKFAKENNFIGCHQISAKEGTNVTESFDILVKNIIDSGFLKKEEIIENKETKENLTTTNKQQQQDQNNTPQKTKKNKKKGCCF